MANLIRRAKMLLVGTMVLSITLLNPGFAFATAQNFINPTLQIGSLSAKVGDNITVPLTAYNFSDITAITLYISYDKNILQYSGYTASAISSSDSALTVNALDGVITMIWDNPSSPLNINNSPVISLQFKVLSSETINTDLNFSSPNPEIIDGLTNIVATDSLPGTISLNEIIPDTIAPVITNIPATITTEATNILGTPVTFITPSTTDNVDPNGTAVCSPASGWLFQIGTSNVICDATDAAGNKATQITFDVIIQDTTAPVITLNGANTINVTVGDTFVDPGATATDIVEGSVVVAVTGTVDTSTVGIYNINYSATDGSGNKSTTSRTVNVNSIPLKSDKNITSFSFPEGMGTIDGTDIAVTVPFGTEVTALAPTITINGTSVSPISGSANDFTAPANYYVTAEDGSNQKYTVTVSIAPNTVADILSFNSTAPAAIGEFSETSITLTVPFGTSLTDLPIAIVLSPGATVLPTAGNATFEDGVAVIYTVTAQDKVSTHNYSVVVKVAANSAKDITSFNFRASTSVITNRDITVTVPFGTDITDISPIIGITGVSVDPASESAQDFSAPIKYTVTAADGSTHAYMVTVTIAEPSDLRALATAIATAKDKHDTAVEGNLPGQYPAPLKGNLQAAIDTASAIKNSATQSVVDAAVKTLNDAIATFEAGVVKPDTTKPVITLLGSNPINLYVGDAYTDAGATAADDLDGNITAKIVVVNNVNTSTAGTYTVTYNVSDNADNTATQVTRTVVVAVKPVVTQSSGGGSSGGSSYQAPAFNAPIGGFKIAINNGATNTNSSTVNLTLNGGTATRMAISNSSDFASISLATYQATTTWTLLGEAGQKTVYAKFFDQNGTASAVVSTTINLANGSVVASVNNTSTAGQVLGVKITRIDELVAKLKPGKSSEEVNELQNELKRLGFLAKNHKVTNYYGKITSAGVAKYKASKKVVVTPAVTQLSKVQTLDDLIALTKFGTKNNNVKLLQTELKKLGYYPKGFIITNYYGSVTKTSVAKYLAASK